MKRFIKILIFIIFSYFALIGTSVAEECNKKNSSYRLNDLGLNFIETKEWEKALICFKLSAEKDNNPYAQSWIGTIFAKGYGVTKNYKLAFEWVSLAAEQGDAFSMGKLGWHYMNGNGVAQNDEEAVKWFRKAAERGDAFSQERLAVAYQEGIGGLKQDWKKAFEWNLKAARQEDEYAMGNLGYQYATGNGVAQNDDEAVKWYRKGAERGDAFSQTKLAVAYKDGKGGLKQDWKKAFEWSLKAARQGDDYGMSLVGWHYAEGLGVEKSDEEAVKWFRKAAELGDAYSMGSLGYHYASGKGIKENDDEAVKWYRKGAELGNTYSQGHLGWHLFKGIGVAKNEEEAVKWFKLGAEGEDDYSMSMLGYFYGEGLGGLKQSDEEAVKWFRKAAELGDAYSQERLGWHYAEGLGVEKSDEEAVKWYLLAAGQGDEYAQKSLGYHYENGLGVKQSDTEAYKWYSLAAEKNNTYAQNHLNALIEKDKSLKQIDIEEKKSTIAKIAKPLDEKKISEIISSKKESEERREGFMLDENLEIEAIDRKALVVYETFIRASTSATSRREGTVSKDSLIWIAGKVKGTNYYLANDLNGIPIGFVLMSNVSLDDLGNEKGKDDFDFGPYYALLIANDDYKNKGFVDLDTPINDAKAIKSVLENKYGFKVKTLYDATEDQIQEAISSYQDILTEKDNFLIYYAGHGDFKESNQVGYWQGVDAVEKKSWTWIANTDVTNEIKAIKANHVIVIADSCYSGTIITQRSGDEGITREQKNRKDFLKKKYSKTTRVALTSGDIEKVSDAEHGSKHSPFAESLINILKENEETLFSSELHTLIEDQMSLKRTDQLPLWGKIIDTGHKDGGDFAFNPIE